ncbi:hypothetical protein FFWV33_06755 [Flavobacterium faecale]|uniref:Glycosyl hydrolase family 12 n=1 Tax=Flavobacterium faecale TaxID=1355330 RepID=A0A2S1LBX0_9FLAO|nr:hypothetical protein [Flavobacterium faecale]AWG21253.1 hypothetical protein FFWV33_06755 [Flavobacterium faecale]
MKNVFVALATFMTMASCSQDAAVPTEVAAQTETIVSKSLKSKAVTQNGTTTITEDYGTYQDPNYQWAYIQNNIWSASIGDTGADRGQFIWYKNINSWGVQAYTTTGIFSYSGVKSYPSLVYGRHYNNVSQNKNGFPIKISAITKSYAAEWNAAVLDDGGSGAVYNASYDIWFDPSNTNTGTNKYEIMIWTLRKNQNPINDLGFGVKFKANQKIGNYNFDVYKGSLDNGKQQVLTFILINGNGNFNGNIKPFIDFASGSLSNNWMAKTNYLTSIQAGFEICTAGTKTKKANFVTSKFSLAL